MLSMAALLVAAVAVVIRAGPGAPTGSSEPQASASATPAAPSARNVVPSTPVPTDAATGVVPPFVDAGTAPPLPENAPKTVRFGVILVTYRGAQAAPKDARSKAEAQSKAASLLLEARSNFDEAVKKGDRGSTADAGSMPRGVLEPPIEYALFTLDKGELHEEPLDTPRGFWIVRRNE
jgi:hypothetical protein